MPDRRIYYSEEARQYAMQQQMLRVVLAATLGLALGAGLALLFAPESGERLRRNIASALDEGYQRGREEAEGIVEELEGEYPGLRKRVEELMKRARLA